MDSRLQRALQHLRVSAGELGYPHTHLSDEQLLYSAARSAASACGAAASPRSSRLGC